MLRTPGAAAALHPLLRYAAGVAAAAVLACLPGSPSAEPRPSEAEIGETQVYLTPAQAVREIYDGVAGVDTLVARLDPAERSAIARKLGGPLPEGPVVVLVPRGAGGTPLGYAVIGEEIGKYRPITFMVGAGPDLKVKGVEVLVYRESRGGEVRRERFLRQYRGKRAADPIRINRDILNVAGATLSVNAMNFGVKRVLAVLEVLAARNALGPVRTE